MHRRSRRMRTGGPRPWRHREPSRSLPLRTQATTQVPQLEVFCPPTYTGALRYTRIKIGRSLEIAHRWAPAGFGTQFHCHQKSIPSLEPELLLIPHTSKIATRHLTCPVAPVKGGHNRTTNHNHALFPPAMLHLQPRGRSIPQPLGILLKARHRTDREGLHRSSARKHNKGRLNSTTGGKTVAFHFATEEEHLIGH